MQYFADLLGTREYQNEEIVNLLKNVQIDFSFLQLNVHYYWHMLQDGETLEHVSFEEYGTVDYWWILALINGIRDLVYDLPLSEKALNRYYQKLLEQGESVDFIQLMEENNKKRKIKVLKNSYLDEFINIIRSEMKGE